MRGNHKLNGPVHHVETPRTSESPVVYTGNSGRNVPRYVSIKFTRFPVHISESESHTAVTANQTSKERYFVTVCGSVNKLGGSPVDVMHQLLTLTNLDDEHVVGAHRIKHGLNKGISKRPGPTSCSLATFVILTFNFAWLEM